MLRIALTFIVFSSALGSFASASPYILQRAKLDTLKIKLDRMQVVVKAVQTIGLRHVVSRPIVYGFGVAVQGPKTTELVTAWRIVHKAKRIQIVVGNQTFESRVLRLDRKKALASLTISKKLRAALVIAPIAPVAQNARLVPVYIAVHLPGGYRQITWGRLLSSAKMGPLRGYWGNEIPLVNGTPLFNRHGHLLGINFRHGYGNKKLGLAAGIQRLREFLGFKDATKSKIKTIKPTVRRL